MNDMDIIMSFAKGGNFVTLDMGIAASGRAIYRISWFNGKKWGYSYYGKIKEAMPTFKMLERML